MLPSVAWNHDGYMLPPWFRSNVWHLSLEMPGIESAVLMHANVIYPEGPLPLYYFSHIKISRCRDLGGRGSFLFFSVHKNNQHFSSQQKVDFFPQIAQSPLNYVIEVLFLYFMVPFLGFVLVQPNGSTMIAKEDLEPLILIVLC